jgi:transposase InsO family protein
MRQLSLQAMLRRRFKAITESRHSLPVDSNILDRRFDATRPNLVWAFDIRYVWTLESWLYLAVVINLYLRQIVGSAMDERIQKQLTLHALTMACWQRKPQPGLLHNSDRGSQYACHDYQRQLHQFGMVASMSRRGNCWDNVPVERFFGSLKTERLDGLRFPTRAPARLEITDYITYYNCLHQYSALGYLSPMAYEKEQLRFVA